MTALGILGLLPLAPGERLLRDRRVRPRDGAARAGRGDGCRRAAARRRAAADGRPGALHLHRAGRDHRRWASRSARSASRSSASCSTPLVAAGTFVLAFAIVTYLTVVLGELVPKALALIAPRGSPPCVARPIALLERAARPAAGSSRARRDLLRPLGVPPRPRGRRPHRRRAARDRRRGRGLGPDRGGRGGDALPVFDFAGQEVADVMVPWSEVVSLDASLIVRDAVAQALEAPHSRFPVIRGSIDDVAGVVALRDLTTALHAGDEPRSSRSRASCSSFPRRRTSAHCCRSCGRAAPDGARRRRVRAHDGDRHAERPHRGDRRRDRGGVRAAGRVRPGAARRAACGCPARSRATTSTRPSTPRCRPRASARSAGSSSPSSAARRGAGTSSPSRASS